MPSSSSVESTTINDNLLSNQQVKESTPLKGQEKDVKTSGTPKSSGVTTPRRIKPITLEAGSPKVSVPSTSQSSSPQPRRVPLKVITPSKN